MSNNTDTYKTKLLLSLDAQRLGDIDKEDRILSELDSLWLSMNSFERTQSDSLTRMLSKKVIAKYFDSSAKPIVTQSLIFETMEVKETRITNGPFTQARAVWAESIYRATPPACRIDRSKKGWTSQFAAIA